MEIVWIAGVYNKSYTEIMNLFADEETWKMLKEPANIDRRLQRNLAKIALAKTK